MTFCVSVQFTFSGQKELIKSFSLFRDNMQLLFLGILALFWGVTVAVPAQEKRVHHKPDLSDHAHDDAHGFQYDHEAFLGKEEAKTFDQLSPEESKERLG